AGTLRAAHVVDDTGEEGAWRPAKRRKEGLRVIVVRGVVPAIDDASSEGQLLCNWRRKPETGVVERNCIRKQQTTGVIVVTRALDDFGSKRGNELAEIDGHIAAKNVRRVGKIELLDALVAGLAARFGRIDDGGCVERGEC